MERVGTRAWSEVGDRMESILVLIGSETPRMTAGLALVTVWLEFVHGVNKGAPPLPPSVEVFLEISN